jgi:hypothetical protein
LSRKRRDFWAADHVSHLFGCLGLLEDKDDIFAFLEQSRISEKNVAHLERMAKSDNPQVACLAAIVLDVAVLSHTKPEDSSSLPTSIRNCWAS